MNNNECVAVREAEIPNQNSNLGAHIEHLTKSVSILAAKISSSCRPEPTAAADLAKPTVPQPSAPLAATLYGYASKITRLIDKVEDLTNRCELGG
jgi:hypothetical protein